MIIIINVFRRFQELASILCNLSLSFFLCVNACSCLPSGIRLHRNMRENSHTHYVICLFHPGSPSFLRVNLLILTFLSRIHPAAVSKSASTTCITAEDADIETDKRPDSDVIAVGDKLFFSGSISTLGRVSGVCVALGVSLHFTIRYMYSMHTVPGADVTDSARD